MRKRFLPIMQPGLKKLKKDVKPWQNGFYFANIWLIISTEGVSGRIDRDHAMKTQMKWKIAIQIKCLNCILQLSVGLYSIQSFVGWRISLSFMITAQWNSRMNYFIQKLCLTTSIPFYSGCIQHQVVRGTYSNALLFHLWPRTISQLSEALDFLQCFAMWRNPKGSGALTMK